MSNLIDTNRLHFQKIFEVHQQKGTLSYTDALKICSSLKIFPDLLTSQEIRKIFLTLSFSDNGFDRLTFLQFESFIKICGKQAFKHSKKKSDDYESLISYIKETSQRRYGASLESSALKGRNFSKTIIINDKGSKLKITTPKNKAHNSFFKPPSEKNLNSKSLKKKSPGKLTVPRVQGFVNLLSPGIRNLKNKIDQTKFSALTDRRDGHNSACSTSPSPYKPTIVARIGKVFNDFQASFKNVDTKKFALQKQAKKILEIERKRKDRCLMLKFAFTIWKISV